jgi:hypothetical protein
MLSLCSQIKNAPLTIVCIFVEISQLGGSYSVAVFEYRIVSINALKIELAGTL